MIDIEQELRSAMRSATDELAPPRLDMRRIKGAARPTPTRPRLTLFSSAIAAAAAAVVALFTVLSPGNTDHNSTTVTGAGGAPKSVSSVAPQLASEPQVSAPSDAAHGSSANPPASAPITARQALTKVTAFFTGYLADSKSGLPAAASRMMTLRQQYLSPELNAALDMYERGTGADPILREQDVPMEISCALSQMAASKGTPGYAVVDVTEDFGAGSKADITVVVRLSDGLITYMG
jgi:hypothetical protein